jgi:hypothetical protein
VLALSIEESIGWLCFRQRPGQQILEKHGAQRFDGGLVKCGEKATEGATGRQAITPKEGHERLSPRLDPLVEGFQRAFATDGIADEDGDKINHVVMPEASTSKAYLFLDGGKHALVLHVLNNEGEFSEPTRRHWSRLSARLDIDGRRDDTGHRSSFQKGCCLLLPVRRHIFRHQRYLGLARCASRGL